MTFLSFSVSLLVAVGLYRSYLGYKVAKASGLGKSKDWIKAGLTFGFTNFKAFAPK